MGVCGGMCLQWWSCPLNRSTHMRNEPTERVEKPENQGNGTPKKLKNLILGHHPGLSVVLLMVVVVVLLLPNLPDHDCSGLTTSHCCYWCWLLLVLAAAGAGCCWCCSWLLLGLAAVRVAAPAGCVFQVCVSLIFAFFHVCGRFVSHMGHPI